MASPKEVIGKTKKDKVFCSFEDLVRRTRYWLKESIKIDLDQSCAPDVKCYLGSTKYICTSVRITGIS